MRTPIEFMPTICSVCAAVSHRGVQSGDPAPGKDPAGSPNPPKARRLLHLDPRTKNGDGFAEEIQSVIELRKRCIDSGAMVRSNQLYWSRFLAFGWHEVKGAGESYLRPNLALAWGRSGLLALQCPVNLPGCLRRIAAPGPGPGPSRAAPAPGKDHSRGATPSGSRPGERPQ